MSSAGLAAMECVVVHDLFLNETANYAHVFLPGSTFLEKDGTFTNAERRINRVRKVMAPKQRLCRLGSDAEARQGDGPRLELHAIRREIMDEIAATTPTFAGVSYDYLDKMGSVQWPCNEKAPDGTPIMHIDGFVRGKGKFIRTEYVRDRREDRAALPAAAHHRPHPLASTMSARRRGAPTMSSGMRRTGWRSIRTTPSSAASATATGCGSQSRAGETTLRALITDRVAPGVVYTTFHHPDTQANVITTDFSDWATNCPEYKVTAVQVGAVQRAVATGRKTTTSRRAHSRRIVGRRGVRTEYCLALGRSRPSGRGGHLP